MSKNKKCILARILLLKLVFLCAPLKFKHSRYMLIIKTEKKKSLLHKYQTLLAKPQRHKGSHKKEGEKLKIYKKKQMAFSIFSSFLPEGLLSHFDIVDFKELGDLQTKKDCLHIYLDEKKQPPKRI